MSATTPEPTTTAATRSGTSGNTGTNISRAETQKKKQKKTRNLENIIGKGPNSSNSNIPRIQAKENHNPQKVTNILTPNPSELMGIEEDNFA